MTVFRFRLEPLLRVRRAECDGRRIEFADSQRAEAALRQQFAALAEQSAQARREANVGVGVVSIARMRETERFAAALDEQQQALRHRHKVVVTELETRRAALAEAEQQVRLLENLRERQAEEARLESSRRLAA